MYIYVLLYLFAYICVSVFRKPRASFHPSATQCHAVPVFSPNWTGGGKVGGRWLSWKTETRTCLVLNVAANTLADDDLYIYIYIYLTARKSEPRHDRGLLRSSVVHFWWLSFGIVIPDAPGRERVYAMIMDEWSSSPSTYSANTIFELRLGPWDNELTKPD